MSDASENPDYELFVRLFARHERGVPGLVRAILPSLQDVDDVMQEVGLGVRSGKVGSAEISTYQGSGPIDSQRRDTPVLFDDAGEQSHAPEAERRAIEVCLQKRPVPERTLLLSVHTRGDSISQLAKQLGQRSRRLYSKVNAPAEYANRI